MAWVSDLRSQPFLNFIEISLQEGTQVYFLGFDGDVTYGTIVDLNTSGNGVSLFDNSGDRNGLLSVNILGCGQTSRFRLFRYPPARLTLHGGSLDSRFVNDVSCTCDKARRDTKPFLVRSGRTEPCD